MAVHHHPTNDVLRDSNWMICNIQNPNQLAFVLFFNSKKQKKSGMPNVPDKNQLRLCVSLNQHARLDAYIFDTSQLNTKRVFRRKYGMPPTSSLSHTTRPAFLTSHAGAVIAAPRRLRASAPPPAGGDALIRAQQWNQPLIEEHIYSFCFPQPHRFP